MSKKVIGALLALIMVLSVFSLSALAIGQYDWESTEDAKDYKQTWGLADGGNGVVQVTLSTNYEVGPISFVIEGVTLETVTPGNGYYAGSTIEYNKSTGLVFLYPATDAALKAQSLNNAVVATFTYTGNATPAIKNNPKQNTATGMNGTLIAARCSGEYVNSSDFYVGQTCEILAFGQAPKPEEPSDVTLTGVGTGVVDNENKYVYGIPVSTADPSTLFTTTGYIELVNEVGTSAEQFGTGDKLNLYKDSSKAELVESYTIIIFGDVNGDGAVGLDDASAIQKTATYLAPKYTGYLAFAADVNAADGVGLPDASAVQKVATYLSPRDTLTNPWAAKA